MKEFYQEMTAHKIFLWNSLNQTDIEDKLLAFTNYYTTVFTDDTPVEHLWDVLYYMLDIMDKSQVHSI